MRRWSNHPNEIRKRKREEREMKSGGEKKVSSGKEAIKWDVREKGSGIGGYRLLQRHEKYRAEIALPGKVSWRGGISHGAQCQWIYTVARKRRSEDVSFVSFDSWRLLNVRPAPLYPEGSGSILYPWTTRARSSLFSSGERAVHSFSVGSIYFNEKPMRAHTCAKKTDTHTHARARTGIV